MKSVNVSDIVLRRLPKYIHFLRNLKKNGQVYTSATQISNALSIHHTQVRKDIALTGLRGTPKVGHKVNDLLNALRDFLNWNNVTDAFLVGAGNVGKALLNYPGFEKTGVKIVAAFDVDTDLVGKEINGIMVFSMEKLSNLASRLHAHIGILCTPAAKAQETAEMMCEHGIIGIWNFTPVTLRLPKNVVVENVDMYPSLAVLSHKVADIIDNAFD
jgi:redox-sensing transcriptional repressor